METLCLGRRPGKSTGDMGAGAVLSHVPNHLACMYLCFLHGPMCIFFSFMHFLAAWHSILIKAFSLSDFPMNTSGNRLTNRLYSALALAISNSARKFNSITTLTSPFLALDLSTTSIYECSPEKMEQSFRSLANLQGKPICSNPQHQGPQPNF